MMKKFLFGFFCFLSAQFFSQELNKSFYLLDGLDSSQIGLTDFEILRKELNIYHKANHDTIKALALLRIAEESFDERIWSKYNDLLLKFSREKQKQYVGNSEVLRVLKRAEGISINNIGYYYYNYSSKSDSALYYYEKGKEILQSINSLNDLVISNANIANVYQNKGKYAEAIELYNEVIGLENKITNKTGVFSSLNNIANIYVALGDTVKAIQYLQKCLLLAAKYKDDNIKGHILHNLGLLMAKKGKQTESIQALKASLYIREKIGDRRGYLNTLISLASAMNLLNNPSLSLSYLNKAKDLLNEIDNPNLNARYYQTLAETESNFLNDIPSSVANYKKAISIYESMKNYVELDPVLKSFLAVIGSDPKYRNLRLESIEKIYEIGKIISKEEAKNYVLKLQFNQDMQMKEAQFKIEQALKDEQAKNEKRIQQYISITFGFVLILVSVFSFFIYKALKLNKQNTAVIQHQKTKVEHQNELLAEKQKEIIDSINYAKRIQDAYLPPEKAFNLLFEDSFVLFKPKDIVSGDFYWFFCPRNKNNEFEDFIFFAVADCTGHGVPGAIMSVICCNALNEVVVNNKIYETDEILNMVRNIVKRNLKNNTEGSQNDGMDIALGKLNKRTLELSYSGANNPMLVINQNGIVELKADKQPVGNYAAEKSFTKTILQVQKGDMIYLSSDGFPDQFGGNTTNGLGKKLKYANFKKLLLTHNQLEGKEQKQHLLDYFYNWKADMEQTDDVCVMGIRT